MRNIIILLTFIPLLYSCQSQEKYLVEDAMMKCFTGQYEEYGIDVSKSIDSANSILIGHKVLPNISGKSFIGMIQAIRDSNGLPFKPSTELINSLNGIQQLPSSINCRDSVYVNFDSTQFYNSKLVNFIAIFDSIAQRRDISIKQIANDFLNAFDEQDFDHPLYSTFGTLALSNLIKAQNDNGILSILPPSTTTITNLPDSLKVILEISMLEGDKIFIDGDVTDQSNIMMITQEFIKKNEPSGIIKINSKRSVSYELYINVLDDVNLAYDNYRDTKSIDIYGVNYESLSPEQQQEIRSKYPKLISISEPEF